MSEVWGLKTHVETLKQHSEKGSVRDRLKGVDVWVKEIMQRLM